jgi:hypothetical protein
MTKVEGTNDYSIVSKLSAANAGFFADEFLAEFVEKPRKRAPLINWGYFLRQQAKQFLKMHIASPSRFLHGKLVL